jgi:hypothetical protein
MAKSDGGPPFKLSFNDKTRDALRQLFRRATVVGAKDRFARAMAEVETALRTDPRSCGDPIGNLTGMRMTRYRKVHDRLRIVYAVHVEAPAVWLLTVEPLRGNPLWIGEG